MVRTVFALSLVGVTIVGAGCARLVTMEPPSPDGPRISALRLVPERTVVGCPVTLRFRFEAPRGLIASTVVGWVRGRGRSWESGRATLSAEVRALEGASAGEVVAPLRLDRDGRYWYYVQVEDREGRKSNVLREAITVDGRSTDEEPRCSS